MIKKHQWFGGVDWNAVENLKLNPPIKPEEFDRKILDEPKNLPNEKSDIISFEN